jgi:uncharacterized protein (DUF927 family)
MGKREKEHRKKVEARNRKLAQSKKTFMNKFREELAKEIEVERNKRIAENPELAEKFAQASAAEAQTKVEEDIN